ncbi:MAG: DNA-3-methyladenine glycosylase 2 family protein [Pseudomonadota bacterium]
MSAPSEPVLVEACEALSDCDAALARAYRETGLPVWREAEPRYENLARIIAYQQLSTKAAGTIWGRVLERHGSITPDCILDDSEEGLRSCGLSRPKIRHLKSIADAVTSGALCFDRLCSAPIDNARDELVAVKGIGPWTAEIFLMNAVGKLDAFPVGDVGLMEAYKQLADLEERHEIKAFSVLAEDWRPYRGVAAHLLWGWINMMRDKNYP